MNRYTYTPFGELLTGEGSGFRFNSEYYDSATGMLNLRARQYEPSVMRFSQRDLLKGDQSAPLSLNRYLYCENDSVNFVDPSGRSIADLWNKAKTAVSNGVAAVKKVTAAAKNVVSVAKENVKSFITETKSKVSNSVAEAKAEVKNGIIKTAAKITSAATTLTNNVKTTISNTRTNVLDWYGRNEETITKCLKTAAVVLGTVAVVALTVASAGAVAAAAGVMFAGTALAGSAATLATIGVYGLATVTGLFGASNVGEIWSGNNVVRDTVFGGNQTAYDYTQAGLTVLSMGTMQFASYNSGLVRSVSTADDPTDETVGSSAGEYASKQAAGATQSGSAGSTACTAGNNGYQTIMSQNADDVNSSLQAYGYSQSPYTPNTKVDTIQLTESTQYVRVYDGVNSQQAGGWLMRAEDIAGLTPQQIQNKFALPSTPLYVTDVVLEAGTVLRTGTANGLFGFSGGGTQFDLMGQYIGDFINPRLLP